MATCLQTITYAMRMNKVLGLGKEPKAAEEEEGMAALQSLYDEWRTGGMFGTLCDEYLAADATAEEGKRYLLATGVTLTEPSLIAASTADYSDCDYGSGAVDRQPRDMALYEKVDSSGTQTARLYDRTEWVNLLGLASTDIAPLSGRNAYGLAACLATSGGFISAFGAEPSTATVALARHFLRNVMSKIGSTQDNSGASYF